MSSWKTLDSPTLKIPLELREVTVPGSSDRIWEIQELRKGCVFKATLAAQVLQGGPAGKSSLRRQPTEPEIERAVCLAVEEALLSEPEKEPGVTYEITVNSQEMETSAEMSR